ncbi:MAG: YybH family protein [Acidimicrobiales bacterium]
MTTTRRDELQSLTAEFMAAFNRNDLDGVISFFAPEGAYYDEFNGTRNDGLDAIRAAFEPQFGGAFGAMKFLDEDLFVDDVGGKVMVSWRCTLEVRGEPTGWRGLDLLHWDGDRITAKLTYAKAKVPLLA